MVITTQFRSQLLCEGHVHVLEVDFDPQGKVNEWPDGARIATAGESTPCISEASLE